MKSETRGRKTILTPRLARRISTLLSRGATIESAALQCGVSEKSYHNWIERGRAGEPIYEGFFFTASRAREQWKQKLIETVMAAAHEDARHAEWLLERQFPRSFAPYERRPIPQEEPTSGVKFIATLPSGATADIDEIWKVARQCAASWQPKERPKDELEPEHETEQEIEPPAPPFNQLGRKFTLPNGG
jgi:hypothetical protein